MEKLIFVCDGWMHEVVVAEFNSVGDEEGFGGGVDDLTAAVVFQGGDEIEVVGGTEFPGGSGGGLVVDEYAAADGAKGVASKLKGPLKGYHADVRVAMVDRRRRLSDISV